jgi:hypothetical protein
MLVNVPAVTPGAVHVKFPVPPGAGVGVVGADELKGVGVGVPGLGVGVAVAGTDEPTGVGLAGTGVAPLLIGATGFPVVLVHPTAAATAASAMTASPVTRTFINEPPSQKRNARN